MNKTNYIGLYLAKKLKKAGCEIESWTWWHNVESTWDYDYETYEIVKDFRISGDIAIERWERDWDFEDNEIMFTKYPAYSYYDIIVTYADKFFGEDVIPKEDKDIKYSSEWAKEKRKNCKLCQRKKYIFEYCGRHNPKAIYVTIKNPIPQILELLQQGKQEEADNYIWDNCVFNQE